MPLATPSSALAQTTEPPMFTIFAIGNPDLFGGDDPDCPGCDGDIAPEDEDLAEQNPLPQLEFRVLDGTNTEIASQTTEPLGVLQRAMIEVPALEDGEEYTLELVSVPAGWELCSNDEGPTRTLTLDDFQLGDSTREDFFFWVGCQAIETPTSTPTGGTVPPNGPTATPRPTRKPGGGGDTNDLQRLGSIKGLAFIDQNQDGRLGPTEPGLNDVGVHLRGGGLDLFQITGPTGQFSFEGLGAGEYDVFIQPGPEWRVTTPSLYKVKVNGNMVQGIDFGLVRTGAPPAKPTGPRLPATGVADLPMSGLLGVVALVLSVVAAVGFGFERRRTLG